MTHAPIHDGDPTAEPLIRLVDVRKSFGRKPVLKGVSIGFRPGRTTVVLGPSGCGKSVMLKHLIGLLRPDAGEVWFETARVDQISESNLTPIRKQFGFLFQHSALFDSYTVRQNIVFPLVEHTAMTREQRHARVQHVLAMVGLADVIDAMPADLSGGQRKRIALARAIVLQPRVILYDEPTTGLDPVRAGVINELIVKLKNDLHATSIVVTHDLTSAFRVADDMIMLHDGQVILRGSPEDFRHSDVPLVRRFLSGEASPEELADVRAELAPAGAAATGNGEQP
jgi:phospholipid/cholesterol/gamma-HCH transport system ATP-binding protein